MTDQIFNQPLGGNEMPRFAGPGTMFRLPSQPTPENLDIGIIGVPLDVGTSLRPGARFGEDLNIFPEAGGRMVE